MPNRMLVGLMLLLGASCGGDLADFRSTPGGPARYGEGKLFISWTLGGQAPSESVCAGVARLDLRVESSYGRVTISPIPCTLDRFRFDGLPAGASNLILDAYDSAGCRVATGRASATLSATLPENPAPTLAVSAVKACH
jgi:hypothetical protein